MLRVSTLLLSCASACARPAAFLHVPSTGRPTSIHRAHITSARAKSSDEDSGEGGPIDSDADDELAFKRKHGSYRRISHEDQREREPPFAHAYSYSEKPHLDGEDDEEDDLQAQLNRISWLPSLLSSRRRRRSTVACSRRENPIGSAYDGVDPHSIELLPVLPIRMIQCPQDEQPLSYGSGVWTAESSNEPFASPAYLPHTNNHRLSIAEPRYKRLYDDLISLGDYWGTKRRQAQRDAYRRGVGNYRDEATLPDPQEMRRFVVTYLHPQKDGVLAEYGVLFQLRDLDEVAAIASYDDDAMDEMQDWIMSQDDIDIEGDLSDVLLDTHYEASHDVVGRVRIHRVMNPECWTDGAEELEYLLAEASVIESIPRSDRAKAAGTGNGSITNRDNYQKGGKVMERGDLSEVLSTANRLETRAKQQTAENVADAISRIREELRYAVDEAFTKRQQDNKQAATTTTADLSNKSINNSNNQIPLVPRGILIEKRTDESLLKEEQALRESFAKLVALQQELKEKFRFTRDSVKSFGIGSIGMWLSTAAWSKFIDKRLEGANMEMQEELQEKLLDYLSDIQEEEYMESAGSSDAELTHMEQESIDFDDLTPELQEEFTMVQNRAAVELGPAALQRSIQIQRIIQAKDDAERLNVLKECVDDERRRLEAKKMVRSAVIDYKYDGELRPKRLTRRQARQVFEKLVKEETRDDDFFLKDAFQ